MKRSIFLVALTARAIGRTLGNVRERATSKETQNKKIKNSSTAGRKLGLQCIVLLSSIQRYNRIQWEKHRAALIRKSFRISVACLRVCSCSVRRRKNKKKFPPFHCCRHAAERRSEEKRAFETSNDERTFREGKGREGGKEWWIVEESGPGRGEERENVSKQAQLGSDPRALKKGKFRFLIGVSCSLYTAWGYAFQPLSRALTHGRTLLLLLLLVFPIIVLPKDSPYEPIFSFCIDRYCVGIS